MSIADPSETGGRKPSRFSAARGLARNRASQQYDHTTPVPESGTNASAGPAAGSATGANYDPSAPTQAISVRKRRAQNAPANAVSPAAEYSSAAATTTGTAHPSHSRFPAQALSSAPASQASGVPAYETAATIPAQTDAAGSVGYASSQSTPVASGASRRRKALSRAAQRAKERYQSPSIGLALMFAAILVVLAMASGAMPFLFSQSILMQLSMQYGAESAQTTLSMIHAFALVVAVVRVLLWALTLRFIARGSSWIRIGATFVAVLDMGARLVSMNGQALPGKQPLDLFAVACCLLLVVALWAPSSHAHFTSKSSPRRH